MLNMSLKYRIQCPEMSCSGMISTDKVIEILKKAEMISLLHRYEFALLKECLEKDEEFRWCAHGCGCGQIYSRLSNPKMVCWNCNRFTCFIHQTPWHETNTCDQFQKQIEGVDPDTKVYLDRQTKRCPNCHAPIEKFHGCDHITCTRCRREFCWECLVLYDLEDSTFTARHKPGCKNSYQIETDYMVRLRPAGPWRPRPFTDRATGRSRMCNIL